MTVDQDRLAATVAAYRSIEPDATVTQRIQANARHRLATRPAPAWRLRAAAATAIGLAAIIAIQQLPMQQTDAPYVADRSSKQAVTVSLPAVPTTIRVELGRLRAPASLPSPPRPAATTEIEGGAPTDTTSQTQTETRDAHS